MKILKLDLLLVLLFFLPVLGSATTTIEKHKLECCDKSSCPTILDSPSELKTIQTAVFGTEIAPLGSEKLIIPIFKSPGYREWRKSLKAYDNEISNYLSRASCPLISIKCSSATSSNSLTREKVITCPEGEGMAVIDRSVCSDIGKPYSIIWIIKTKSEKERDEVLKIFDEAKESGIAIEDFVVENGDLFNKVDDEVWEVVPPPQPGLDRPGVYPMNPDYVGEDEDLDEYIANIKREFDERQERRREKQEEIRILENRNRDIMGVFMGSLLSGSGSGF